MRAHCAMDASSSSSPLADHLLEIFTAKLGWKLGREMIHFLEVPWGGLWQESATEAWAAASIPL